MIATKEQERKALRRLNMLKDEKETVEMLERHGWKA